VDQRTLGSRIARDDADFAGQEAATKEIVDRVEGDGLQGAGVVEDGHLDVWSRRSHLRQRGVLHEGGIERADAAGAALADRQADLARVRRVAGQLRLKAARRVRHQEKGRAASQSEKEVPFEFGSRLPLVDDDKVEPRAFGRIGRGAEERDVVEEQALSLNLTLCEGSEGAGTDGADLNAVGA
jgi:hypothetical protein